MLPQDEASKIARGMGIRSAVTGKYEDYMKIDSTKLLNEELKKTAEREKDIRTALQPMEDGFKEMALTGEISFSSMIKKWEAMLADFASDQAFAAIAKALAGGGSPTGALGLSGLGAGLAGAVDGGAHAFGGSWVAPNTGGGQDSVTAMFRMSPGETATFSNGPPPGGRGAAASSPPAPIINIINGHDPRGLDRSREGIVQVVLDDMAKNPGKYRSLIPAR
jgi:hypothetical protein